MMYKNILVAYDGSILSWKAIEAAKFQASIHENSKVHVVSVIENTVSTSEKSEKIMEELKEKFFPQMKKIEEEFEKNNISATMEIILAEEEESPGDLIAKYSQDYDTDLIVMGSRGLGDDTKVFLGSVSNEVVQKVKCPVLIIKDQKQ